MNVQSGVRIDDYGSWLHDVWLIATVTPCASQTTVETRIVRNGRFDTYQNSIMMTAKIMGHSFSFRSRYRCLNTRQERYPAIKTCRPSQGDVRPLLTSYLCVVGKIRCEELSSLIREME